MFAFERYKPSLHGPYTPPRPYPGKYVVIKPISLADISFDPAHDTLAGHRRVSSIGSCPRLKALEADPTDPVLGHEAKKQPLIVVCDALRYITEKESNPVCAIKAGQLDYAVEELSPEYVASPAGIEAVGCPFNYLGGVATSRFGWAEVAVAVVAQHPDQTSVAF